MFKFKQYVEDVENFELDEDDEQSEAVKKMSFRQRQQRSRLAKGKNRNKMKLGARRQKKKIASLDRLKKRARRSARRALIKKVSGGKSPSSVGAKNVAMGRVATGGMQKRLVRTTKIGVKTARKRDMTRKQGGAGKSRTG
jgi:hypothetical protein